MRAAVALAALAAACHPARDPLAVPPAIAASVWQPAAVTEHRLSSGLVVIQVENHRLPYIAVSAVVAGAGSRADGAHVGLAALAARLAGDRHREQLDRALAGAGAALDVAITADAATFTLAGPSDHLGVDLGVIADVVRKPRVDPRELDRVRATTLDELGESATRPRSIAARTFERLAFGPHPYAHAAEGTASGIAAIAAADVAGFWTEHYRVRVTTLVVVGDVTAGELDRLLAEPFASSTDQAEPAIPAVPITPAPPQVAYVDLPGAAHAIVMVGHGAGGANDPRAAATDVASQVLAGGAASRIAQRLGAAATGVSAGTWRGAWGGTWTVVASVDTAATGRAIREMLAAIAELARAAEIPELARAREALEVDLAAAFDSDEAAARAIARRIGRGESIEQLRAMPGELARVDEAGIRAAAASWTDLTIVIVGDWSLIAPTLPALGLPIHRYEAP